MVAKQKMVSLTEYKLFQNNTKTEEFSSVLISQNKATYG